MTDRLYYENSYITEFEATIIEQYREKDYFAVILDQSAFYPRSGGQMHDYGTLNDQPLLNVVETGEKIIHLVQEPIQSETVIGKIDWARRFDFMQQHTAFHILAQSFLRQLHVPTLSSHLGENEDTIDIDLSNLTWQQALKVEQLANQIVQEARQVVSYWIKSEEARHLPIRKMPEFHEKPVRLVDISNFDLDPCGGTHVTNTGEVGMIKIISWEKVRGNIRCTFLAGRRALREYQSLVTITQKVSQILSTTVADIPENVEKIKRESKLQAKENKKLHQQLMQLEAEQLIASWKKQPERLFIKEFQRKNSKELQQLAVRICRELPIVIAFYNLQKPGCFVMACSDDLQLDLQPLIPQLQELLNAKGGGHKTQFELNQINNSLIPKALQIVKDYVK